MASFVRAALALAFMTFASVSAFADEARGKIASIDPENYVLVLDGNRTFAIPEEFYVEDLEPGMTVVIQYEVVEGENVISDLEIGE